MISENGLSMLLNLKDDCLNNQDIKLCQTVDALLDNNLDQDLESIQEKFRKKRMIDEWLDMGFRYSRSPETDLIRMNSQSTAIDNRIRARKRRRNYGFKFGALGRK